MKASARGDVRCFLLVVSGLLLVQTAWALVVPPFRGLDEHDHAYKAAAVAEGDWSPDHTSVGTDSGGLVTVPDDIVEAAGPVCNALPYTEPENCSAVGYRDDGLVTVASNASQYHPLFYFVIGTPSKLFEGSAALYAMRATAALACALLIGLAAMAVRRWARTTWPYAALVLVTTPTLLYSTVVAAPNGIELAGALTVWAGVFGWWRDPRTEQTRFYLAVVLAGALPLVVVRTLGPLWLLLIGVTITLLLGGRRTLALLQRRDILLAAVALVVAAGSSVAWMLAADTNSSGGLGVRFEDSPWIDMPKLLILWVLQMIAAFPARDELAPMALYTVPLIAWWVLTAVALRRAAQRERLALALVALMATLVPVAITVATFAQLGSAWQGRYGYPFAMGFFLLCGAVLDRVTERWSPWLVWSAAAALLLSDLWGKLGVLDRELQEGALAGDPSWITPSVPVVVVLNVVGMALLAWAWRRPGLDNLPG